MNLLPPEIRSQLPRLGATDGQGDAALARVKFFTPDANWTWYVTEFDGEDTCFGLVAGLEIELGYFSLSELTAVRGPFNLPVERDLYFQPVSLAQLPERHSRREDATIREQERVMEDRFDGVSDAVFGEA